jgi:hypothetical protein
MRHICLYLLFKSFIYVCWLRRVCFLVFLLNGHLVNCIVFEWKLINTEYYKIFVKSLCATFILCQHFTLVLKEYLWGTVILYGTCGGQ